MAVYVTQAQCESRFTPRTFRSWFIDDGSGTPNAALITDALEEGSRKAQAILGKAGWDDDAITAMASADASVRGPICDLVASLGMRRKIEFWGEGPTPRWRALEKSGEDALEDIVQARRRPAGEAQAGANPIYETRVTAPEPNFVFAPSGGKNQSGGF